MLVAPIFQILLFAYIGRSAHLRSDEFYLIGNALQYVSVPCLFAMSQAIRCGSLTDSRNHNCR